MIYPVMYRYIALCSAFAVVIVKAETAQSCNSSLTSNLRDGQFYASSQINDTHKASSAKKNGAGWIANSSTSFQYLQIDLGRIFELTAIDIQAADTRWYIYSFRISNSFDGKVWFAYNTRLSDDPLGEVFERTGTVTRVAFTPNIQTRYIAINPKSFSYYPSLRIELYGCEKELTVPSQAVTQISADIETDTTWIPSQSPIVIDRPVVVYSSSKLTIQPGVSVIFTTEKAGIHVYGTLSAEGISGLEVLFSSDSPVLSAKSNWQGLSQGADGIIIMKHATVRQAYVGIQGHGSQVQLATCTVFSCKYGLRLSGGLTRSYSKVEEIPENDIHLLRLNVHNNEDGMIIHGMFGERAFIIGNSMFEHNENNGITISNSPPYNGSLADTDLFVIHTSMRFNGKVGILADSSLKCNCIIHNSSFVGNKRNGFLYSGYFPKYTYGIITISDSMFSNNGYEAFKIDCTYHDDFEISNVSLINNHFSGHSWSSVDLDLFSYNTWQYTVFFFKNNTFVNNYQGINVVLTRKRHVDSIIDGNVFTQVRIPIKITTNDIDTPKAVIHGNNFTDIASTSRSDIAVLIEVPKAEITNNTFVNCSISSIVTLTQGYDHYISFNTFVNSSLSPCYVTLKQDFNEAKLIKLDQNYWDTSEKMTVKVKVCDFFYDSTKVVAVINSYSSSPQMDKIFASPEVDDFRYERDQKTGAYIVGGTIEPNTDLPFQDGDTLIVNRSILIRSSANMTLGQTVVNFTASRGIAVYGSLVIGGSSGVTYLQKNGTYDWNGIVVISAEIILKNTKVADTSKLFTVFGNNTTIFIDTLVTVDNMQQLIRAEYLNGQHSFTVFNCTINTLSALYYVRTNDSMIFNLKIANSVIKSNQYIIDAREINDWSNNGQIVLNVTNSSLISDSEWLFYFSICNSHASFTITNSILFSRSSYRYHGTIYVQSPSIHFSANRNVFSDTRRAMDIQLCDTLEQLYNHSHIIDIDNNVFNSSIAGESLYFYRRYRSDLPHHFRITNNIFEYGPIESNAIVFSDPNYQSSTLHTLIVGSNIFRNMISSIIEISHGFALLLLQYNTFQNNYQCIHLSRPSYLQEINDLKIAGNIFINNTHQEGIILLDRQEQCKNSWNIINNTFENNLGIVVAFKCPQITINYNFFENDNALYNLKSLLNKYRESVVVNASLNYWGTTNIREITKKLYYTDNNANIVEIVARPYLGSRNFSDIRDDDISHTFVSGNEIGGHVNGNITVFVDRSPYLAVSNIEVDENDTLTIEAGVVIAVQQDVGINVVGRLNVFGSAEKPVTIKSNTVGMPWKGIIIDTDKGSVIRYLVINDTKQGLTVKGPSNDIRNTVTMYSKSIGITVDISRMYSVKLTNIYVAESMESGIYVTGNANHKQQVSFVMTDCVIDGNSLQGMHIDSNIRVELKNCTIKNNKKSGIKVQFTNSAVLHINDSVISSNLEHAIDGYITDGIFIQSSIIRDHNYGYWYYNYWFTREYIDLTNRYNFYDRNTSVVIRDSQFLNNIADGIRIHSGNEGFQFNIVFEGNRFSGGNKTFLFTADNYYFQTVSPLTFEMTNNIIEHNKESLRSKTNRLFQFDIAKSKQFIIRNNRFKNNTADTGLFIMQSQTSSALNVVENVFLDNNFTSDVLHIFNQMNVNVFKNKFKSPQSPECIMRVPAFDLSYFINATHNYWGTGAVKDVTEKVCSFDKDMDNMFVLYLPYYIDDSFLETSQGKSNNFDISGAFGGEIAYDLTISNSQFPLGVHIDRSIIIRPGVTLTIEDGVSLYFAANRGIYIQGTLKALGETKNVRLVNAASSNVWYGIVFNSTYSDRDYSLFYKTDIFNTSYGLIAHKRNLEIRRSHVRNSANNCLTLTQDSSMKIYDFEMTVFEDCSDHGIYISEAGSSSIVNAVITNATFGVGSNASFGLLEIRACNISNTRQEAVNISYLDLDFSVNITVESCNIVSCEKGLVLKSKNRLSDNNIKVSRNVFSGIKSDVLNISYQEYQHNNVSVKNKHVSIYLNEIHDSCGIFLKTWNNVNLKFKDNVLSNSSCFNANQCYITGFANGNENASERLFEFSANVMQNISGFCIVHLKTNSSEQSLDGLFVYNQILSNRAVGGVVFLEATRFNVTNNIFDNPVSPVEVYTDIKGSHAVNVTRNWWGSSDANRVYQRIFDQTRDPSLILFNVTPVLTERHVGCSGVNNCSNHGDCISSNRCRCNSGWSGSSCSDYECAAKNDCYGNGLCVGPNKCNCLKGWSGASCIVPSCNNVNNCSDNGICVRPDMCSCAAKFTGSDCSSCVALHWGPECRPCPECQHGSCDLDSGKCICDGNNWSGYLCDRCSEKFYGPSCLPLIKVLYVLPSEGSDKGGNIVHVWGHNFPETANHSYICRFGSFLSNGTWLTKLHIVCQTPKHQEGTVFVEISPDGKSFTNDRLTYFFRATCPAESCGQSSTPSRGQCLFGLCSCFLPWMGENCSTEMLAPRITRVTGEQSVAESANYTLQLSLEEGHRPVQWRLIKGPAGLEVDETGLVSWNYAYTSEIAYHIEVQATNTIGQDVVTWLLHVPVSYSVEIERIEPSGVLPLPRPIYIYGYVMFSNTSSPHVVPVDVTVISNRTGKEIKLSAMTHSLVPNTFVTQYIPRPDDAGGFTVRSGRPGASETRRNLTWSVLGLKCSPSNVIVSEKILSENSTVIIRNLSVLLNIGEFPVENITSKVDSLPGAFIRKSAAEENSVFFFPKLSIDDAVYFDLVIPNAAPLYGTIYVLFISKGGTTTHLRVGISLSISKPVLVFAPSSVTENVIRGTQTILDIQITNIGEVDANHVQISLPNDNRLALVSFSTVGTNDEVTISSVATNASITAGGSAYMSLSVTIAKTAALGEMTGTIYVNSDVTSTPLSYRFYIVSLQKFNVTFKVKDEFTYFAAGSPLVSNAIVKLVNPRQGYSETKYTTNDTDGLLFEDIAENQYTLYVEADGHSHYSAVILVTTEQTQFDIFLQRIAVKYTWTVTPTGVEDKYVITLESTFETYVPMPVVTVEPAKVNTIPYELGEKDTIVFNITNHGLIRADNLRFNLPTDHPYLIFESTVDFLGNLDANTSIIVPLKTIVRNRVRRAVGSGCGMVLLYDIYCGGVRTTAVGITLTREYPGAPPRPCGWDIIGHGPSGLLGFGSIIYGSTTPLTCDCAKTLIKSCILGFHPILGCAFALEGLSSLDSGGVDLRRTILAITDIYFGCFPTPVGPFYTAVRCLMDVNEKCVGGKRKREVSSDVVYNLLSTAKMMDNFLSMMTEIQGGKELSSVETSWYQAFKKTVGENTELGTLLSESEASSVLNTLTDEASKTKLLNGFLTRWNNTAAAWENGTLFELENRDHVIRSTILNARLKQYLIDNDRSASRGFGSIFDEYNYAVKAYRAAEQHQIAVGGSEKEGICARVRVRITQDFILTREAFNARLEIENGENFDLKNIEVWIEIKETFGDGEQLSNKFSIGTPNLLGITGIDGVGWLGKGLSGSAEWLIIPHADAAPQDDTLYDVGGRLSYVVDGSPFTVPLLPDTITVKPNPSLVVHYFHEKYVQGDDAMTTEIEPIVPFSLAVLVKNNGYGVARALRITSAQPEIIENEKGLLIAFKIIAAQLGDSPITPSLSVNFGDIQSFATKSARWLMTSTLAGTFFNYSATFENINPMGDPQLSLIDEIGYHELFHLVRIELPAYDDNLDDFLVNDFVDQEGIPDRLYNSANGTDIADVYQENVTDVSVSHVTSTSIKVYTHVRLKVIANSSVWFYTRLENSFISSKNDHLLSAMDGNGRALFVDKNVWETTHILDKYYLHIFDYIQKNNSDDESERIEHEYFLIYGPRNAYAPNFNSTAYSATIPSTTRVGFEVLTVNAYDVDKDDLVFRFESNTDSTFQIIKTTRTSAVITVNRSPLEPGEYTLILIVEDLGIPSKSSSANLTIVITDTTLTTQITMSSTKSSPKPLNTTTTTTTAATTTTPYTSLTTTFASVSTPRTQLTTNFTDITRSTPTSTHRLSSTSSSLTSVVTSNSSSITTSTHSVVPNKTTQDTKATSSSNMMSTYVILNILQVLTFIIYIN